MKSPHAFWSVPIGDIQFKFVREFEQRGVDVQLVVKAVSAPHDIEERFYWHSRELKELPQGGIGWRLSDVGSIEIKPTVGDDYPKVLRQMRVNGSFVLFVGSYTGTGATCEQFVLTMATAGIRVVFAEQLGLSPPPQPKAPRSVDPHPDDSAAEPPPGFVPRPDWAR